MFDFLEQLINITQDPDVKEVALSLLNLLERKGIEQRKLTNVKGFIYKVELVDKVFGGSKYKFLQSLKAYQNHSQWFASKYFSYQRAQKIPIYLVSAFLRHIDEQENL